MAGKNSHSTEVPIYTCHFTNSFFAFFMICERLRKKVMDADTDTYSILIVCVSFALVPTPPAVPAAR